jgi:hypothetical protein
MAKEIGVTSVRLYEKAQEIKLRLEPIYGWRNIVSAGLWLFDKLPPEQQQGAILAIQGLDSGGQQAASLGDPSQIVEQIVAQADRDKHTQDKRRRQSRQG